MKRTQIYLDDELFDVLKMESQLTDQGISSIIRDVLRNKFLKKDKRVELIDKFSGLWKDRNFNIDKYI
jgi:hypothetical protein